MELGLDPDEVGERQFAYGKGCNRCNGSGYRGRTAIFEIMTATDEVRELILEEASTQQIRECAREQGMRSLRESGILAVFDQVTTIQEVVKETIMVD